MEIPESFQAYCDHFHQDVFVIHDNLEAAIDYNVSIFNKAELKEIDDFLTALLAIGNRPQGLKSLWRKLNGDIWLGNNKTADYFFQRTQQAVKVRLEQLRVEKAASFPWNS